MITIPAAFQAVLSKPFIGKLEEFARDIEPLYEHVHDKFPTGNDHGARHISRVLERYASLFCDGRRLLLSELELYFGAVAIIAHDIGMLVVPRDGHARIGAQLWESLQQEFGYVTNRNDHYAQAIAHAISSHSSSVDLNTVPAYTNLGVEKVRTRMIAAAVRLCDELDEDARRAHPILRELLGANENVYWQFNAVISGIAVDGTTLVIEINIRDITLASHVFRFKEHDVPFGNALAAKLAKTAKEIFYCSDFLHEPAKFTRIIIRPTVGGKLRLEMSIAGDWFIQQTPDPVAEATRDIEQHLSKVCTSPRVPSAT